LNEKRLKAKTDLRYLFEEVLNYGKGKLDDFHLEIIEELKLVEESVDRKGLFLLPRGHWKSTLITVAYTIQKILQNPDISVFISNAVLNNSVAFLREIKNHFEKNERLIELFGDWVGEKWGEGEIIVKPRTSPHKEPTIRIGSVEHSVVSSHFDLIILDDLVERGNTGTREQCNKVIQYFKDSFALGKENNTTFLVVGTLWHHADLYQHILAKNKAIDNFRVLYKTCWKDKENFVPLFYKFTKDYLLQLKKGMGNFDFAKQYENTLVDDENAKFKMSWLQNEYYEKELISKPLTTFITIDPAESTKDDADYTAVIVNSVDEADNWYLRYVKRLRINPTQLVELIFDLWTHPEWKRSGLVSIGLEKKAFADTVKPLLKTEGERRGLFPYVVELKAMKREKTHRIEGALAGRFEYGKIFFRAGASDNTDDLRDELIKFPLAEHDDLSDGLAYQQDIVYHPSKGARRNPRSKDEEEMLRIRKLQSRSGLPTVLERI